MTFLKKNVNIGSEVRTTTEKYNSKDGNEVSKKNRNQNDTEPIITKHHLPFCMSFKAHTKATMGRTTKVVSTCDENVIANNTNKRGNARMTKRNSKARHRKGWIGKLNATEWNKIELITRSRQRHMTRTK